MTLDFLLPDLGEGLVEAEIVGWLVAPGDAVAIDQPVVELESAKSVVQLPSPYAGVVARLGGEPGAVLHAGDVLLTLGEPSDPPGDRGEFGPEAAEPGVAVPLEAATDASGAVLIGYGTRPAPARRPVAAGRFGRRRGAAPAGSPPISAGAPVGSGAPARSGAPVGSGAPAGSADTGAVGRLLVDPARHSPVVSPIVRRMAREHGFDASGLQGTGRDRLVLRRDVEAAIASGAGTDPSMEPPAFEPAPLRVAPPGHASATDGLADRRIPLDRTRRAAAALFSRSRREIPEATVWLDVDATGLVEARHELELATGERFGVTAFIARFVVAGLVRHPSLNASFDAARDEVVLHGAINLGTAMHTPRGLVVPVVHDAGNMSFRTLRDVLAERSSQAKTGAFPSSALAGGTFTLNNYGALGVDGSAAIINHPEAAMLGIGRLVERPWVVDGALAVRTITELTLSFDHRVCDGAEAAAFLRFVASCVEHPVSLLAEA